MSWAWGHRKLAALGCMALAVAACSGGVLVAQAGNGPMPSDPSALQWAVGVLSGTVMFLLGGAAGNLLSYKRLDQLNKRLTKHEALAGHPVAIQRIDETKGDVRDLKSALLRFEGKLDRVIERQAEG